MKITFEQSQEAAKPIKIITEAAKTLNIEYLEECLKGMKGNVSLHESATILDPNPFTVHERIDLEKLGCRQLELILALGKNLKAIEEANKRVAEARSNSHDLARMFGL
jgi:hypothetical protein